MADDFLKVGRRRFMLGAGALAGAAALGRSPTTAPARAPRTLRNARGAARNAIFMVADGMSAGTLTLADTLCRARHGRPSHWVSLWNQPGVRRASAATYSADSYVTDSAAGASAWSIGERVNNGALNITPDGRSPAPILVRAKAAGKATGLVTTTRVTHATPAAFAANVPRRGLEREIAAQILERGVDVVLGGGRVHFPDDLLAQHPDRRVVRTRGELLAHPNDADAPLLGLFAREHMSYSLDRTDAEPTLAEMTRAALAALDRHADGFVLQIEGGRVDQGAHENDAAAMLNDQLAFDEAIAAVLDFVSRRDDTLVILTSDHGTANPGLTFYGRDAAERFDRLAGVTRSFEWISAESRKAGTAEARVEAIPALVTAATGVELSPDDVAILRRAALGERVDPFLPANGRNPLLGSLLANHLGVSFVSPNHTSDFVEVTALGPGAETLPGAIENIDLHALLVRALDLPPTAPGGS